jgi:hypothetical protein
MQCNIDARGKAARLVMGAAAVVAGLVVGAIWYLGAWESDWAIGISIALIVMGGVGIFEGAAGWCVIRAMGFRTKI